MLRGSITIDVDTLATHFKGYGLRGKEYSYLDFTTGINNCLNFLDQLNIKATFFIVGKDLLNHNTHEVMREIIRRGHEIANHTMNHIQGFRLLTTQKKEEEIQACEDIIYRTANIKPSGFRTPGWNISNDTIKILQTKGYQYESSIFPSFLNPLLKFLHWKTMHNRPLHDRSTLGQWHYMFAPLLPYRPSNTSFLKKNGSGFIEIPLTVVPIMRLPFFATFLLKTGLPLFNISYALIKLWQRPIIYGMHLFDFVDFEQPVLNSEIPPKTQKGVYIPQSVHTPLKKKFHIFFKAISIMKKDYIFTTLKNLAQNHCEHNTKV